MVKDTINKFSLAFSTLALIISILTFLKTGGIVDIKKQINIMKKDIKEVKSQTEMRMENRSILFDALYELTDSVDSLRTGNISESKRLINEAIEKIVYVERRLTEKKRLHLEKIRNEIEKLSLWINPDDIKTVGELEYQIRLLRIFEENL